MYLIDSDILIYSLKNHPQVRFNFKEKAALPKSISVITYSELYYGAKKSKQETKNIAVIRRISELFPIINTTKSIMETFSDLKAEIQRKGSVIADFDLIIAATALSMNFILVSNNVKHFSRVPSLQIENWTK